MVIKIVIATIQIFITWRKLICRYSYKKRTKNQLIDGKSCFVSFSLHKQGSTDAKITFRCHPFRFSYNGSDIYIIHVHASILWTTACTLSMVCRLWIWTMYCYYLIYILFLCRSSCNIIPLKNTLVTSSDQQTKSYNLKRIIYVGYKFNAASAVRVNSIFIFVHFEWNS